MLQADCDLGGAGFSRRAHAKHIFVADMSDDDDIADRFPRHDQ